MNLQLQSYLLGESRLLPEASVQEWQATVQALVASHLPQLQQKLPSLLPALPEELREAVVAGLVASGEARVAPILAALDSPLVPKPLRKAVRRALHLLSTKGISLEPETSFQPAPVVQEQWRAWFTTPDPHGNQRWLLERKSQRIELFEGLTEGNQLRNLEYADHVLPSEVETILQDLREEGSGFRYGFALEIDPHHARWRLLHAAENARKRNRSLPLTLPLVKKSLKPPDGSERHPIWLFFNSFDLRADPSLRDPAKAEEVTKRPYQFWPLHPPFGHPDYRTQYEQALGGRLRLPPSLQEQRLLQLYRKMVADHLDEGWLEDWRWRLQDYAYAWYRQGWIEPCRLALYWFLQMNDLDPEQNPFLRFFLQTNLEIWGRLREVEREGRASQPS